MRRKNEDELIKLAFGDFEPGEAPRAKQILDEDATAAKLFASYTDLREGLKQLKTPEHQLSTERLRERILADGLRKEKASGWSWRWTFAPIAVAAGTLAIMLNLGRGPAGAPAFVANPDVSLGTINRESPIDWQPTPSNVKSIVESGVAGGQSLTSEPAPEPSRIRSAGSDFRTMTASRRSESTASSTSPAISPEELSNLAIDGALPAGAVALHETTSGGDPIVLIGAESDETTGANRATEVSSATNVVIGG